jgi:hypothetical protein
MIRREMAAQHVSRRAPAWRGWHALILGACALALLSASSVSLTLCIGDDGHVEVERSVAGRCADDGAAAGAPGNRTAAWVAQPACCGSCTDLDGTLSSHTASERTEPPRPAAALLVALAFPDPAALAPAAGRRAARAVQVRVSPRASSAILRC